MQRVLDLMRQAAGQLTQRGEALQAVEFLLALARVAQLIDHLVEAAGQKSDFVAPAHLGHRLQAARRDVLCRRGHHVDRPRVAVRIAYDSTIPAAKITSASVTSRVRAWLSNCV